MKATRAKGTKKVIWHGDKVHQRNFDHVKATITKDEVLANLDISKVFKLYTDASSKQLVVVITQENRPFAFFSRKLYMMQQKYSVTKIELLAIVETLEEFEGMLWGQSIKMFTDRAKYHERCSRLNLGQSVPMEVIAGRVGARNCLCKRHAQHRCRFSLAA
jgi:hypothetical protein